MTSHVIDRIRVENLSIEIYSDGECVMHAPQLGFMQISAKVLARIANASKNLNKTIDAKTAEEPEESKEAKESNPISILGDQAPIPSDALVTKQDAIPRNIKNTADGWVCTLQKPGSDPVVHVYASRSLARAGQLGNAVGVAGRVA